MDDLRVFLLIPLGFALLGTLLVWWGIRQIRAVSRFKARAGRTRGVCVGMHTEWIGGGDGAPSPLSYPVVRFALPDGRSFETVTRSGASPPPTREGREVNVAYDPDDPMVARVDSTWADGSIQYSFAIAIGSAFAVLGYAALGVAAWLML